MNSHFAYMYIHGDRGLEATISGRMKDGGYHQALQLSSSYSCHTGPRHPWTPPPYLGTYLVCIYIEYPGMYDQTTSTPEVVQ